MISSASVAVPFGIGLALALYLHPRFSSPSVPFSVFALFIAVSMSVTAFPVLARILADRKMTRTPLGALALACAAASDVTAWCLLALVVSLARAQASSGVVAIALVVAFGVAMLALVRPAVRKWLARSEPTPGVLAATLVGLLASGLATEMIGVHALFGAFMFGVIVPHDSPLARAITDELTDFVVVLLLPAFFGSPAFARGSVSSTDRPHGSVARSSRSLRPPENSVRPSSPRDSAGLRRATRPRSVCS